MARAIRVVALASAALRKGLIEPLLPLVLRSRVRDVGESRARLYATRMSASVASSGCARPAASNAPPQLGGLHEVDADIHV
eukprot:2271311-Pyramimonas_sp.AAC.1